MDAVELPPLAVVAVYDDGVVVHARSTVHHLADIRFEPQFAPHLLPRLMVGSDLSTRNDGESGYVGQHPAFRYPADDAQLYVFGEQADQEELNE